MLTNLKDTFKEISRLDIGEELSIDYDIEETFYCLSKSLPLKWIPCMATGSNDYIKTDIISIWRFVDIENKFKKYLMWLKNILKKYNIKSYTHVNSSYVRLCDFDGKEYLLYPEKFISDKEYYPNVVDYKIFKNPIDNMIGEYASDMGFSIECLEEILDYHLD